MAHTLLVRVVRRQMPAGAAVLRTFEVEEAAPRRQMLAVEVLHRRTEVEEVLPRILAGAVEGAQMSPQCALRRHRSFSLLQS